MNNRQNGRRRGRGGMRPQQNGASRTEGGSRIDNRARGNAVQLHDKYKALARDAQMQGDRVLTEYYFQFADHYFRILMEQRPRTEDGQVQQQQRPNGNGQYDMADGMEGEDGSPDEMFPEDNRRFEPRREQAARDDQRNGNRQEYRRDGRDDGFRNGGQQDEGQRQDGRRDDGRRDDGRRDDGRGETGPRETGPRDHGQRENARRESNRRDEPRRENNGYRTDDRTPAPQPVAGAAEQPAPAQIEAFSPASSDGEGEPVRRRGRPRRVDVADVGAGESERIDADRLPPAVRVDAALANDAAPANDIAPESPAPRRRGRPPRARPDESAVSAEA